MTTVWKAAQKRDALFKRQRGLCWLCNGPMVMRRGAPNSVTLDHVVPRSRGGPSSSDNLRAACQRCNAGRGGDPSTCFTDVDGVIALRWYVRTGCRGS